MQSQQGMDIEQNSYAKLVSQDNNKMQSEQLNKIYPINDNQESEIILVIPFDQAQQGQEQDNQVRLFELKMIQLWALQISLQLVMNVMTIDMYVFWKFIHLCAIISLVIMIYTVINNHPKFEIKQDNSQEKILFYIYFFADIFTVEGVSLVLLSITFYGTIIIKILQFNQFVNFICALCLMMIYKKKLFTAFNLSITTSIPFIFIAAFALVFYTGSDKYIYMFLFLYHVGMQFNLVYHSI